MNISAVIWKGIVTVSSNFKGKDKDSMNSCKNGWEKRSMKGVNGIEMGHLGRGKLMGIEIRGKWMGLKGVHTLEARRLAAVSQSQVMVVPRHYKTKAKQFTEVKEAV